MGTTTQTSSNNATVKGYEMLTFVDQYKSNFFAKSVAIGAVYDAKEIKGRKRGDRTTLNFYNKLLGLGVSEGGTLIGNTEGLDNDTHNLTIGLLRHGVESPNDDTIEQNRTHANFKKIGRELLGPWAGSRIDASFLQQAAGAYPTSITIEGATYTGSNRSFVTGFNTVTAPTTNRILRAGNQATDQALTSSDTMTCDLLDDALVDIQNAVPTFKPLPNGQFAVVMTPQQLLDMERDSSGSIQMLRDVIRPITEGTGNSSLVGAKGYGMANECVAKYRNFDIYVSTHVATGVNSSSSAGISTVKRAVIFGADALAYGSKFGTLSEKEGPTKFFAELTDFEYYAAIEARMIYGVNKVVFGGEDYGTFVLSTYAA